MLQKSKTLRNKETFIITYRLNASDVRHQRSADRRGSFSNWDSSFQIIRFFYFSTSLCFSLTVRMDSRCPDVCSKLLTLMEVAFFFACEYSRVFFVAEVIYPAGMAFCLHHTLCRRLNDVFCLFLHIIFYLS